MFCASAGRLAGLAGALLGWRPDEFWAATPAELSSYFAVIACPQDRAADSQTILHLKERFPDG